MILDRIVTTKREEVRQLRQTTSVQELLQRAQAQKPPLSLSDAFAKAHVSGEVAVIAEIKKASPSKGLIREDFQPLDIARTYQENGAAMISILTDVSYFQGSLAYLSEVRKVVDLPLLRKDFVIDEMQVIEARAHGADVVLLIMACLDDAQYAHLYNVAEELGMAVLVEVHTRQELERAMQIHPKVIGVNNRDLHTFQVDRTTTFHISKDVPDDVWLVSESGIESRRHIQEVQRYGADAVLVGESLMRSPDIGLALQRLRGAAE
ncbi:indole-3-glycerol phosphate synthase TrpC [Fodinisporobacter ferrooxydans]|uniref:Indole-3-glycerol phosphate synthase n=1 Tax=Fodinisporobacter ferrooxydans TaxID=2901836 RepID=A0ABY4CHD9_9BACL|nr:indole-3-glycerol phosphate synthase TrpC [Alicyclobacillaceae bacterium MYW30-H2]